MALVTVLSGTYDDGTLIAAATEIEQEATASQSILSEFGTRPGRVEEAGPETEERTLVSARPPG